MTNSPISDYAQRIGNLMTEREECQQAIVEIYADAKSDGITVAALRKAIKIARMDSVARERHETEQTDLLMYLDQIERREAAQ